MTTAGLAAKTWSIFSQVYLVVKTNNISHRCFSLCTSLVYSSDSCPLQLFYGNRNILSVDSDMDLGMVFVCLLRSCSDFSLSITLRLNKKWDTWRVVSEPTYTGSGVHIETDKWIALSSRCYRNPNTSRLSNYISEL